MQWEWKNKLIEQGFNYALSIVREITDFFETYIEIFKLMMTAVLVNFVRPSRNITSKKRYASKKKGTFIILQLEMTHQIHSMQVIRNQDKRSSINSMLCTDVIKELTDQEKKHSFTKS